MRLPFIFHYCCRSLASFQASRKLLQASARFTERMDVFTHWHLSAPRVRSPFSSFDAPALVNIGRFID